MRDTITNNKVLVLVLGLYLAVGCGQSWGLTSAGAPLTEQERATAGQFNNVFRRAVEMVQPTVAFIQVHKDGEAVFGGDEGFDGLGSGFIVDERGYVMTNNHVVDGADKVTVVLSDESRYVAEGVFVDPDTDLAIIKFDPAGQKLPVAKFGNSEKAQVGDFVLAMGSPFGLEQTVTSGIISYKGRKTQILDRNWGYEDFIQTNADINRGNSGGPLVNLYGEVIGVNDHIFTPTGASAGYAFAIPSNIAGFVAKRLIEDGEVRRGYMGVGLVSISLDRLRKSEPEMIHPDLRQIMDAVAKIPESVEGALISNVTEGGPADTAGILPGDVITAVDNHKMPNSKKLRTYIATIRPGEKAEFTIWRDGKELQKSMVLADRMEAQAQEKAAQQEFFAQRRGNGLSGPRFRDINPELDIPQDKPTLGISVNQLKADNAAQYGFGPNNRGVIITGVQPGSLAHQSGLTAGDLITEVNGRPIATIGELRKEVENADFAGSGLKMTIINRAGQQERLVKSRPD